MPHNSISGLDDEVNIRKLMFSSFEYIIMRFEDMSFVISFINNRKQQSKFTVLLFVRTYLNYDPFL